MPETHTRMITAETLEAKARKSAQESGIDYDTAMSILLKLYLKRGYDIRRENELPDLMPKKDGGVPMAA